MPDGFSQILAASARDAGRMLPELIVAAGFLCGLIADLLLPVERRKETGYVCLAFLLAALGVSVLELGTAAGAGAPALFSGMLVHDGWAIGCHIILLIGTALAVLAALHARELHGRSPGEFFPLLTAICLGGMLFCAATNLLLLYIGLELLSIPSYALAGYLRHDRRSAEAGIKYAIYGALASGLMIFGLSYLYGLTGTLDVPIIAERLAMPAGLGSGVPAGALGAVLALVACGFLYKIAAAPLHFWSPDVYEGAPTTATAFFSVVPKAAGFAALARLLAELFPAAREAGVLETRYVEWAVGLIAVATMFLGNLAALGQENAKRMLAYSSIAHAGYMLAALAALDDRRGAAALLFYLAAYLLMNLGAFLVLVGLENSVGGCELRQLRGAIKREPVLCVALIVFLFSLVGMPPLAGFTAKYLVMLKLADRGMWLLVICIGVNSVISLYYYMRLAKAVGMDEPPTTVPAPAPRALVFRVLAVAQAVGLLWMFVYAQPLMRLCAQAASVLP